jgi:tetratricopeptide (TPR) repeat protein
MKHARLLFFCLILLRSAICSAQSDAAKDYFSRGDALMAEKRYADALVAYDSAALSGGAGFDLSYNTGVAAYRTGRSGLAALHWERARRLRPADADVRHNLRVAYARAKDGLQDPEDTAWIRLRDLAGADGWGWAALLLAFAGAAGLAGFLYLPPDKKRLWAGTAGSAALLLALCCFWLARAQSLRGEGRYVVVVAPRAVLLTAPDAAATPLDTLREAAKLPLLDRFGGYYQVALPNGEEPYVEADKVGVI